MKRLLTVILVLTLTIGLIPTVGFAEEGQSSSNFQKGNNSSHSKTISSKAQVDEYVEGEAIILLEEQSEKMSVYSTKSVNKVLPDGVNIDKKIEFKGNVESSGTLKSMEQAKSAESTPDDFVIMAVSSDRFSTEELIEELEKVDAVKYAEPNYKVNLSAAPNDKYYDKQWSLKPAPGIEIDKAWAKGTGSSDNVIAVIDSGVDITHPDIENNLWHNNNTSELAGKNGYNFGEENTDVTDFVGHGTHVAGIIGAQGNNSKGISGVNQKVSIMPLKVSDEADEIYTSYILDALGYINDAQALGVKVVAANMSLGYLSSSPSNIFKEVIDKIGAKGCVSVCAAGNESINLDTGKYFSYPASTDSSYVISVGATNEKGGIASYSNTGTKNVDLYAPGDMILSSVPYNIYNPSIYNDPDKLSQKYEEFNDDFAPNTVNQAASRLGAWDPDKNTNISIADDYFGTDQNALKWEIKDADAGDIYNIYVTYGALQASGTPLHAGALVDIADCPIFDDLFYYGGALVLSETKLDKDGNLPLNYATGNLSETSPFVGADEPMGYRYLLSGQVRKAFTTADVDPNRAIVFTYIVSADGDHTVMIDDLGLSKSGTLEEDFEKYDFYSGTSMATPIVTGIAGLIKSQSGGLTAKQIASKVKHLVNDNGFMDLSSYDTAEPFFDSLKVNTDKSMLIKGTNFGTAPGKVSAIGKDLTITKWSDTEILIDKKHYNEMANRNITMKITTDDGRTTKDDFYFVDGKKSFSKHSDFDSYSGGNFTTDGKTLYYYSEYGDIYQEMLVPDYGDEDEDFDESKVKMVKKWVAIGEVEPNKVFPQAPAKDQARGDVYIESGLTYLNNKFYGIMELSNGARSYYSLAAYDMKTATWKKVGDRPGAELNGTKDADFKNIKLSTLAAYNGNLYLMGGIDMTNLEVKDNVRVFTPSTGKWAKGASLPDTRMLAVGHQVGNKLVLALGSDGRNDSTKVPATLTFDGKNWAKGTSVSNPFYSSKYYFTTDKNDPDKVVFDDDESYGYYREFQYYTGAVGIVSNGIIISGIAAEGLGDTYIYDLSTNTYKTTDYQFNNSITNEETVGTVVDNYLYAALVPNIEDEEDEDMSGIFYDEEDDYDFGLNVTIKKMPVKSGLYSVYGSVKRGKITGIGKYLPGQKVSLTAKPKSKYYAYKLAVDGKTYKYSKSKKTTISASVPYITKNIKVSASFKKFRTKVKLNKKKVETKVGKTIRLKAKVSKPAKKIKGVTWKSSNKKYATVSKSGKVKIKKAGRGKTVTIYATAKDGSKAKAKCKIKIAKKK